MSILEFKCTEYKKQVPVGVWKQMTSIPPQKTAGVIKYLFWKSNILSTCSYCSSSTHLQFLSFLPVQPCLCRDRPLWWWWGGCVWFLNLSFTQRRLFWGRSNHSWWALVLLFRCIRAKVAVDTLFKKMLLWQHCSDTGFWKITSHLKLILPAFPQKMHFYQPEQHLCTCNKTMDCGGLNK